MKQLLGSFVLLNYVNDVGVTSWSSHFVAPINLSDVIVGSVLSTALGRLNNVVVALDRLDNFLARSNPSLLHLIFLSLVRLLVLFDRAHGKIYRLALLLDCDVVVVGVGALRRVGRVPDALN